MLCRKGFFLHSSSATIIFGIGTPSYLLQPLMARIRIAPDPGEMPSTSSARTVAMHSNEGHIWHRGQIFIPRDDHILPTGRPLVTEVSLSRFLSWPAVQCCRCTVRPKACRSLLSEVMAPLSGGLPFRAEARLFLGIPYIQFSRFTPLWSLFPAPEDMYIVGWIGFSQHSHVATPRGGKLLPLVFCCRFE